MQHLILLSLMAATVLHGETFGEFSGTGRIKSVADFISVSLSVHSDCQANPKEAQSATDEVTTRVYKFFKMLKHKDAKHFKILVDGGFSTPYSRFQRVTQQGQIIDREICRNTFQKVTNITLRLDARDDFHKVFSDIQDHVLKNFDQRPVDDDFLGPRTYVSMTQPYPEITEAHRALLEKDALALAVKNAKENFKAALQSCEPHRWKIQHIKDSSVSDIMYPRKAYMAQPMALRIQSNQQEAAPVRFDDLEVSKSVTVTFKFDGDRCYEN